MPRLTESEALTLFYKTPLEELRARAGEQRCHFLPASKATYIVMRIVSYTNVCVADCRYCAFYRRPGNPEGYVLSREEIFKKIDELKEKGGSLVAMEGGLNPALEIEHYENLFRSVRERYGNEIEIYGPTA